MTTRLRLLLVAASLWVSAFSDCSCSQPDPPKVSATPDKISAKVDVLITVTVTVSPPGAMAIVTPPANVQFVSTTRTKTNEIESTWSVVLKCIQPGPYAPVTFSNGSTATTSVECVSKDQPQGQTRWDPSVAFGVFQQVMGLEGNITLDQHGGSHLAYTQPMDGLNRVFDFDLAKKSATDRFPGTGYRERASGVPSGIFIGARASGGAVISAITPGADVQEASADARDLILTGGTSGDPAVAYVSRDLGRIERFTVGFGAAGSDPLNLGANEVVVQDAKDLLAANRRGIVYSDSNNAYFFRDTSGGAPVALDASVRPPFLLPADSAEQDAPAGALVASWDGSPAWISANDGFAALLDADGVRGLDSSGYTVLSCGTDTCAITDIARAITVDIKEGSSVEVSCTGGRLSPTGRSVAAVCDAGKVHVGDNPLRKIEITGTECLPHERSCSGDQITTCPKGQRVAARCMEGCIGGRSGEPLAQCGTVTAPSTVEVPAGSTVPVMLRVTWSTRVTATVQPSGDETISAYICASDAAACTFDGGNVVARRGSPGAAVALGFEALAASAFDEYLLFVGDEAGRPIASSWRLLFEPETPICAADEPACLGDEVGVCNATGNGVAGPAVAVCADTCSFFPRKLRAGSGCRPVREGPEPATPTDAQPLGALLLGQTAVEGHHAVGDVDWYSFTLADTRAINIAGARPLTDDDGAFGRYIVKLTDEAGTQLDLGARTQAATPRQVVIETRLLAPGTYRVSVERVSNNDDAVDYRLEITVLEPACAASRCNGAELDVCLPDGSGAMSTPCGVACTTQPLGDGCGFVAEVEPNDDRATNATALGFMLARDGIPHHVEGALGAGDVDAFSLTAAAGTLTVTLVPSLQAAGTVDARVTVHDALGIPSSSTAQVIIAQLVDGPMQIVVESESGAEMGPYRLEIVEMP